jgi:general secretion pathway protein C
MSQIGTLLLAASSVVPLTFIDGLLSWLTKRWAVILINGLVLLLLTVSFAHWTWLLVKPPTSINAPKGIPLVDTSSERLDLQTILSAQLFGQTAPAGPAQPSLENIPISSLNLSLTGVVVTIAGSYALISVENAPESPFAIGEEVIAGVTLQAVYPDRAILLRGGSTESLMLNDETSTLPSGALLSYAAQTGDGSNGVNALEKNRYSVERQVLHDHMQTPSFLSDALMVPNAGGGFLVREIESGSLYEKLGLKVGDVIRTVNGQTVNSIDDAMRLYQQLGGTENISRLELGVVRAGKQESLSYELR